MSIPLVSYFGKAVQWYVDGIRHTGTVVSVDKSTLRLLVREDSGGTIILFKQECSIIPESKSPTP